MHSTKMAETWKSVIQVALLALLCLLIGFEVVPSSSAEETHYIVVAGFQRANSQFIERSAYALLYRPASQREQAMRDLQSTLSVFQQEQTLLWTNSNPDVQNLLQQAQSDYLSIVVATKALIASPHKRADPLNLDIILSYDRSFFSSMNVLVTVLQQQVEVQRSQLLSIRVVIGSICGMMIISLMFINRRRHVQSTMKQKYEIEQ